MGLKTLTLPRFSSRVFLAPMAGVSDPALRLLCKKMGAGLVVTELTSIHCIVAKNKQFAKEDKNINNFLEFSEHERPISVQLFGSDIDALQESAKIVEPYFDMIDYNMGCPAPHITQQMAGAALLQSPELSRKIFRTLVNSVSKPVSLKMRAGFCDKDPHLFKKIAKIAEDEGIQMITLHPRTIKQGYSGKANWGLIKELRDIVDLPIVGNGDIVSPEDAQKMIDETGCDYVMVGRGAMGNPFLFSQINEYLKYGTYKQFSFRDRLGSFFTYYEYAKNYNIGLHQIKSQAIRFTRGTAGGKKIRTKLATAKTIDELLQVMNESYSQSA